MIWIAAASFLTGVLLGVWAVLHWFTNPALKRALRVINDQQAIIDSNHTMIDRAFALRARKKDREGQNAS